MTDFVSSDTRAARLLTGVKLVVPVVDISHEMTFCILR